MQTETQIHKISVHPPLIHPQITPIGYGNPRYISMLPHGYGVLLSVGATLRWVDLINNKVIHQQQVGHCQIFQIMGNKSFVIVVNFDGLVTFLDKENLIPRHRFYSKGKEIRHSFLSDTHFAVSCEFNQDMDDAYLIVYEIADILKGDYEAKNCVRGHFYYPEIVGDELAVLEYHDPNPKGRNRKETVLQEKKPITNKSVVFNLKMERVWEENLKRDGEIICAARNGKMVYYLHSSKKITVFDVPNKQMRAAPIECKSFPHLVEPYQDGVVFVNQSNTMTYFRYDFQKNEPLAQQVVHNTLALGGDLSLKFAQDSFYTLNQNGIHFYHIPTKQTYTQSLFSITNCGIALSKDADMVAVADFGGFLRVFSTTQIPPLPDHLCQAMVGIPIRSIAWCEVTNCILIGCVGGSLFRWRFGDIECDHVMQIDHTFNILRAKQGNFYAGTSDGQVFIFKSEDMSLIGKYKAHHPVHYQTQQEKEMFGSMKNYAQIWSLILSPHPQSPFIVSSSEDQSQRVFKMDHNQQKYEQIHHLKGHNLAVTSIDWKIMDTKVGEIYVSCSDDKVIRFRDPNNNFNILYEVQTSTIKEWHTLTYLCLQEGGTRLAVGSQNGYLFIWQIAEKKLLFGEKVHLGGIEGMDWKRGKLVTCSSDLCVNVIEL